MKSFFLVIFCALLFLQACKKSDSPNNATTLSISGIGPVAFPSGEPVSIYGTGFDLNPDKDIVRFDGVQGEVVTATANRLQVIPPTLIKSGKVTVTVNGKTVTSKQTFNIVTLLQGSYANSFILTADKKYLLRGTVSFSSKLTIEAGTVIFGEKATGGSLNASDIDFEGTASNPIIFTSDQAPGQRNPGDWGGLTISDFNPFITYVRVEYASNGYDMAVLPGGIMHHLQASYCSGDGFSFHGDGNNQNQGGGFIYNIVAFGCMGNDFSSSTSIYAQFGLGLKDPYYASTNFTGNGFTPTFSNFPTPESNIATTPVLSNFTFIGYNPDARNILFKGDAVTKNAGVGIMYSFLGDDNRKTQICNSVIAASWKAGLAFKDAPGSITYNGPYFNDGDILNNFFAGTTPSNLPTNAGAFGRYAVPSYSDFYITAFDNFLKNGGFIPMPPSTDDPYGINAFRVNFASLNDTTKALSFSMNKDDLGIKGLADYNNLHNPILLPTANSILLNRAKFPIGTFADNPNFNKAVTFVGAFGTKDWTSPWCNFNPQITQY